MTLRTLPTFALAALAFGAWPSLAHAWDAPFRAEPVTSPVANAVERIRVVDLNRDGSPELVVGACDDADGANLVAVYRFDAGFKATQVARNDVACPRDLLVQDFNGDGRLDIFSGAWDGQGPLSPAIQYGTVDGLISAAARPIRYGADHNWSGYLSVVDADGDGLSDIALPYDDSDSAPTRWGLTIVSGRDFRQIADVSFGGADPGAPIGALDVDGDGRRDVVFGAVSVVGGGGVWRIVSNASLGVPQLTPMSRVIDFDGDGALDLLVVDQGSSTMRLCLTRGGRICGETLQVPTALAEAPRKMAIKDVNRDGVKDFVTFAGGRLSLSLSQQGGGFATSSVAARNRRVTGVVVADVNGDRKQDLVVGYFAEVDVYPGR